MWTLLLTWQICLDGEEERFFRLRHLPLQVFTAHLTFWSTKNWRRSKRHRPSNQIIHKMFEIFISCPKIQLWFPEKIVDFLGVKNSWKWCGFGLFSYWHLWFHEKNCQKIFGWKSRENVGVLSKLNFWTKVWLCE